MTNNKKILKILNDQLDIKRAIITSLSVVVTVTIGVIEGALLFQNDTDNTTSYSIQSPSDDDNMIESYPDCPGNDQPNKESIDNEHLNTSGEKPKFRFGRRSDPNGGGDAPSNPTDNKTNSNSTDIANNATILNTTRTLSNNNVSVDNSAPTQDDQQDVPDELHIVYYDMYINAPAPDAVPPVQAAGGQAKIQKLDIVHEKLESTKSTESIESTESTESIESIESIESTESTESTENQPQKN